MLTFQVWENWSPEDEAQPEDEDDDAAAASSSSASGETLQVSVTEVVDGNEFFVQVCELRHTCTGARCCAKDCKLRPSVHQNNVKQAKCSLLGV